MKEEEVKKALQELQNEPFSAFLDFYSDRATAHASFLVAAVFGLFSVLYLILEGNTLIPEVVLSVVYWILWFAGSFSLFKFNSYAMKAHDIKKMIAQKQLLDHSINLRELEKHFEQKRKEGVLLSLVRGIFLWFNRSKWKLPSIGIMYICVGVSSWLYASGSLSWLIQEPGRIVALGILIVVVFMFIVALRKK